MLTVIINIDKVCILYRFKFLPAISLYIILIFLKNIPFILIFSYILRNRRKFTNWNPQHLQTNRNHPKTNITLPSVSRCSSRRWSRFACASSCRHWYSTSAWMLWDDGTWLRTSAGHREAVAELARPSCPSPSTRPRDGTTRAVSPAASSYGTAPSALYTPAGQEKHRCLIFVLQASAGSGWIIRDAPAMEITFYPLRLPRVLFAFGEWCSRRKKRARER